MRSASEAHQKKRFSYVATHLPKQREREYVFLQKVVFPLVGHIKMCSSYSLQHFL